MFRWMYVCLGNNVIHENRFLGKATYRVEVEKKGKINKENNIAPY